MLYIDRKNALEALKTQTYKRKKYDDMHVQFTCAKANP